MGKGKNVRKKAESNRERDKSRRRRQGANLDHREVASFAKLLLAEGYELKEVGRDGNCFFRSLCDQLENHEHEHEKYRLKVMEYVEAHEEEFAPFMSFGESEEEEDRDFGAYIERMKTDAEWAGQVELIAAAQALGVHIVVHQYEHPSYRIECRTTSGRKPPKDLHLAYHDGEHYNSVRPLRRAGAAATGGGRGSRYAAIGACESEDEGGGEIEAKQSNSADSCRLVEGVATLHLGGMSSRDKSGTEAEADGGDSGSLSSRTEASQDSAKESRLKGKALRKEEKRLRKEQRHREALAAASGGADESAADAADSDEPTKRNIIVL